MLSIVILAVLNTALAEVSYQIFVLGDIGQLP